MSSKKKRNPNIEWLRIIAMFMVIVLHALGKGNLLNQIHGSGNINSAVAWLLESFAIVAVNVYVFISGYVLIDSKFKCGRILEIILEAVFYGIVILLVCIFTNITSGVSTYEIIQSILPIHSGTYWFMTVYVMLYLITPVLSKGVKTLNREQHLALLCVLIAYESVFKTLLPIALGADEKGYSLMWFIILFLIAAYIKQYGFSYVDSSTKGIVLYLIGVALIYLEHLVMDYIFATTGRFELLVDISTNYNHIFALLASLGLFAWGINKDQKENVVSKIGIAIAPMSLGVYLIHEHILLRFKWMNWFNIERLFSSSPVIFIISILAMCLCVYIAGSCIDYIRIMIFSFCKKALEGSLFTKGLVKLDCIINGTEDNK